MRDTQERLNKEIEELNQAAAHISSIDRRITSLEKDLEESIQNTPLAESGQDPVPDEDIISLINLSQAEEYRLRDALDEFDERRAKMEHSVDKAHEALNASQADFEFHIEDGRLQQNYARARKTTCLCNCGSSYYGADWVIQY